MDFVTVFCIGAFVGFLIYSIVVANNEIERMEKAYQDGVKDGKEMASSTTK